MRSATKNVQKAVRGVCGGVSRTREKIAKTWAAFIQVSEEVKKESQEEMETTVM